MKTSWLCSVAVLCASSAFGQTSSAPPAPAAVGMTPPMISMTGCVAGGSKAQPVTLTNALVLPFGSPALMPDASAALNPPPLALLDPSGVSDGATQPRPARGRDAAAPATIGTSGTVTGTAPAGSSASIVDGYRLSGVDMTSWIGRRVEITGAVVPMKPLDQPVTTDAKDAAARVPMPEFRVMSVQPVTGPCPK